MLVGDGVDSCDDGVGDGADGGDSGDGVFRRKFAHMKIIYTFFTFVRFNPYHNIF